MIDSIPDFREEVEQERIDLEALAKVIEDEIPCRIDKLNLNIQAAYAEGRPDEVINELRTKRSRLRSNLQAVMDKDEAAYICRSIARMQTEKLINIVESLVSLNAHKDAKHVIFDPDDIGRIIFLTQYKMSRQATGQFMKKNELHTHPSARDIKRELTTHLPGITTLTTVPLHRPFEPLLKADLGLPAKLARNG